MHTWKMLALMPPVQLAGVDVAAANLACAEGLPYTERMNVPLCLERLDSFARLVGQETERRLPQFHRKRWDYHNSEAYFRTLALVTVLQRDCALRYNPLKIAEDAPIDAGDSFIFGLLQGPGGTCATMPVVYVAVGRRLGYPLKLVEARGKGGDHLFARWDDGRERFNIEATAPGLSCPPDAYFRTGRYLSEPDLEVKGGYLCSKTPQQELAFFLAERFQCWKALGRHRQAVEAMAWASALEPENAFHINTLKMQTDRWLLQLKEQEPPHFPRIEIRYFRRRYPATLPLDVERNILGLEAMENLLNDPRPDKQWWEPLRRGGSVSRVPARALVDHQPDGSCKIRLEFDNAIPN